MKNSILPNKIENYLSVHKEIHDDLLLYEKYFQFYPQAATHELARAVNQTDYRLIPIVANLIRSNMYINAIHELREINNRIFTYSPHFLRAPLIKGISEDFQTYKLSVIFELIKKMESDEQMHRKMRSKIFGTHRELDIPIMTSVVLSECNKKEEFINSILDFRNGSDAEKIRNWFTELQNACHHDDENTITRIEENLRNISNDLQTRSTTGAAISSLPQIDSNILDGIISSTGSIAYGTATGDITLTPGIVKSPINMLRALNRQLEKRDILFLINLKRKAENIQYSRKEFERVFGVPFK